VCMAHFITYKKHHLFDANLAELVRLNQYVYDPSIYRGIY